MNKQSLVLVLVLALSLAMFAGIYRANAIAVQNPTINPQVIQWISGGAANYANMSSFPQFLAVYIHAGSHVYTPTTLYIDGMDIFSKSIEASVTIPAGFTDTQHAFVFTDTVSGVPVAFKQITRIYQQNGTDNEVFDIYTYPEAVYNVGSTRTPIPLEQYFGYYETTLGYLPGEYPGDTATYQVTLGHEIPFGIQAYPFEPMHPEPIKVVINWIDSNLGGNILDRFPEPSEISGANLQASLTIYGMDQWGQPQTQTVTINPGNTIVKVTGDWSTICNVTGGAGDTYYLFTEPITPGPLFTYTLLIDHISMIPQYYDFLANPTASYSEGPLGKITPGTMNVTVALLDCDNNPLYAADYDTSSVSTTYITVNFFTSAGTIRPSTDLFIYEGSATATANLTADTNARTINVTAVAWIPPCTTGAHGAFTLFAWTQLVEDGVNTANDFYWGLSPIDTLHWGYTNSAGQQYVLNVPPKPYLPSWLGGPQATQIKLDGPIFEVTIPLYQGCNLVSCPVSPMLNGGYYTNYPTTVDTTGATNNYNPVATNGIPMNLLFSQTDAPGAIEAIWWYTPVPDATAQSIVSAPGTWHVYVPGVSTDPTAYFRDGIGYWIKADINCTIEISGVAMENGPFTPPTIPLAGESWNLVGVTSITGIATTDYLEGTMGYAGCLQAAGPIWEYNNPLMTNQPAYLGGWFRDPSTLYPTQAFWVYNKVPSTISIAP